MALIKEGKAAREAQRAAPHEVVNWTEHDYGFPGYYEVPFPSSLNEPDLQDNLRDAIYELVNAVSTPAPADTPRWNPNKWKMGAWSDGTKRRDHDPWPFMLSVKGNGSQWSWGAMVLIAPRVRAAIDAVDQAIRAALVGVYQEGKERGSSALLQMAGGEMSMTDFEEAIKPRKER